MAHPSTDPSYLADQYGTSERLRIRIETHAQYTVGEDDFETVEQRHLRVAPGQMLLDAGCGPGRLARQLRGSGAKPVGIDRSFSMLREASRLTASFAQADVVALPFAEATFDRVAALGVLYHVRDWRSALRELRRVCRADGGRIIVSTNGRQTMRRLLDLHFEAACELGYVPLEPASEALRLEDLDAVREILPTVELDVLESALVFPTAEPAVRFYATNRIDLIDHRPLDDSHHPRLIAAVRRKIEAIIAREGAFRVPKSFGYFVADLG